MSNIKIGSWVQRKDGGLHDNKRVWQVYQITGEYAQPNTGAQNWCAISELELATPREHADLIVQWAYGAKIEYINLSTGDWEEAEDPSWYPHVEYRLAEQSPPARFTKDDVTATVNRIQQQIDELKKYFDI